MSPHHKALLEEAARPYFAAGSSNGFFARGKLRHDPVFLALLERGCLPDRGTLIDLGCGRGLLLALLETARERYRGGQWPGDLPAPPMNLALEGVELQNAHVRAAQSALYGRARVTQGDIRARSLPSCSAVVVLDVLLHLDLHEQEEVLRKAAAALEPGGLLLLREADAAAGLTFRLSQLSERTMETLRGRPFARLRYRRAAEWAALLESLGFAVAMEPMSAGTPFANVLFHCRKR